MKYRTNTIALLIASTVASVALAQNSAVEQMEKVIIKKVKKIQLPKEYFPDENNGYFADLLLTIRNDNSKKLGLKDFDFKLTLKGSCDEEASIDVGTVRSGDKPLIIEGNSERDFIVSAYLGSDVPRVFRLITGILNLVGDPQNQVCLILEGRCKVGEEGSRGWYFQDAFEVSLYFRPQLQREVLVQ